MEGGGPLGAARPALTDADRRAVLRVSRAAFDVRTAFEPYAARRLASTLRQRATWWLLEADGAAVASLLCYPLQFAWPDGEERGGYGLGSVGTLPEHQGRGYATELCAAVHEREAARGCDAALLFSAIGTRVYGRMGFTETPAHQRRCSDPAALAASGPHADLRAVEPRRHIEELLLLYRAAHRGPYLQRDVVRWLALLEECPDDSILGWGAPLRGYIRICAEGGELELVELIAPRPSDAVSVVRAVAAWAEDLSCTSVCGWLTPDEAPEPWFVEEGRERTLPMVRGFDGAAARFWGTDYF